MGKYIELKNLEVYKLAREISKLSWEIYEKLNWQAKKIIGDQFIESMDSIGANIAEGYGRFHYLDKIKFYYNARGSLLEAEHWTALLNERKLAGRDILLVLYRKFRQLNIKLNRFINSTFKAKENKN